MRALRKLKLQSPLAGQYGCANLTVRGLRKPKLHSPLAGQYGCANLTVRGPQEIQITKLGAPSGAALGARLGACMGTVGGTAISQCDGSTFSTEDCLSPRVLQMIESVTSNQIARAFRHASCRGRQR